MNFISSKYLIDEFSYLYMILFNFLSLSLMSIFIIVLSNYKYISNPKYISLIRPVEKIGEGIKFLGCIILITYTYLLAGSIFIKF